ncbi:MAG: fimbrial protein, partial [Bacteroidaceae bacterium]
MRKSEGAHYLVFLLVLLLFLPLLNSCKEDENSDIGTGKSATIKVSVGTSSATTSRSLDEDAISNLHVLVFNSSGQLVGWNYATSSTVNVQTIQGRGFTIYAVANTGSEDYFSGITTLEAFKLKTTTAISDADAPGSSSGILMCGSLSNQTIDSSTMSFKDFKLTRLLAKITLTVTPASGVTVTGYRFRNVPSSSYVTPNDADASEGWIDGSVFGGSALSSSSVEISDVSFYMYENRRGTRATVDGSTGTTSKESEKATYAPSEATYVEIYA